MHERIARCSLQKRLRIGIFLTLENQYFSHTLEPE
jgi:hypothetical protein